VRNFHLDINEIWVDTFSDQLVSDGVVCKSRVIMVYFRVGLVLYSWGQVVE